MNYSFEYIDIILLAMIAGFIFLRLRGILGKRTGQEENIDSNFSHSLILTTLKNFIYPLIAFVLAKYIFILSPMLIFIVTMAAALPSGTQTYYFSFRYNSLQKTISANVVISTFISFFTLSFILYIFGY